MLLAKQASIRKATSERREYDKDKAKNGVVKNKEGATVKSHPLNNAFQHGVTAWRLVTRSALSNFVIVRWELYHNGGRHDKRED